MGAGGVALAFLAMLALAVAGAVGLFVLLDPRTHAWLVDSTRWLWEPAWALILAIWEALSSPFR